MKKENKYKISVIVPVYNAEKYLEKCIQSILHQKMKEIEIILVDDGSLDKSAQIIQKFKKENENIVVISQENKGAIEARIQGYNAATGEYIGFVDNDDFIEKDMYQKLYEKAIKENADIAICNYKFYPKELKNKKKWYNEFHGIVNEKFVKRNNLLWNKIVKKEYLDQINITDLFNKAGESAYTIALIRTNKIVTINEELYNYRIGQKSLSSDLRNIAWHEKGVENAINKYEIIKGMSLEQSWSNFFQYSIFYSMFKMLLVAGYNSNKQLYKKYKQEIGKYKTNSYCRKRFEEDYGKLKSFIILKGVTNNYYVAKLITKML